MDGPSAQGVLSLTAFQAEGGGIALTGDEYKVSVTDLLSVSYGMICILVISCCAAPPYPAAPDFLHGKACHTLPSGSERWWRQPPKGAEATGLERLLFPRKKSCSGKLQDLMTGRGRWSRTTDNGVKVRCLTAWRYPHIKESAGQGPSFPVFR